MTDATTLRVTVPNPPSANRLWRNVPGMKRPVLNPAYAKWRAEAAWIIKMQTVGFPRIDCRFDAELQVPVSRRDSDNWTKPLLDILQHSGFVSNDGNMRRVLVIPVAGRTDCCIAITPLPDEGGVRAAAKPHRPAAVRKPKPASSVIASTEAVRRKVLF